MPVQDKRESRTRNQIFHLSHHTTHTHTHVPRSPLHTLSIKNSTEGPDYRILSHRRTDFLPPIYVKILLHLCLEYTGHEALTLETQQREEEG